MTTDFLNASNNSGWLFFYANYFLNASNFAVVVISKSNNSHPNAYTDYVILQLFELISVKHDSHTLTKMPLNTVNYISVDAHYVLINHTTELLTVA